MRFLFTRLTAARLKIACSRARPGTKMRAASRPFPRSDLPIRPGTATRIGAAPQKSLWKFLLKFSKFSPPGYEQANQPHLRIRRVPIGGEIKRGVAEKSQGP